MDGQVHNILQGKTIAMAVKDGSYLILETTCGHQIRVAWVDKHGEQVKGEPKLVNVGVKLLLPGVNMRGVASL